MFAGCIAQEHRCCSSCCRTQTMPVRHNSISSSTNGTINVRSPALSVCTRNHCLACSAAAGSTRGGARFVRWAFPSGVRRCDLYKHGLGWVIRSCSLWLLIECRACSICQLGESGKRSSPAKIGKFGLGFNAIYHLAGSLTLLYELCVLVCLCP